MTIQEAIRRTEGRDAGIVNRLSARYAQTLLQQGEEPFAAVVANIATVREHFPGIAVLTDRRVLVVCGLPGIKRAEACGQNWTCREDPSAIRHKFTFSDEKSTFSITLDPDTGEQFSRQLARLRGEEDAFDAAGKEIGRSGILNPALLRGKRRARQAKEMRAAAVSRSGRKTPVGHEPEASDAKAEARRLARQLEEARTRGHVADTDPRAVAARLAAELAEKESD